MLLWPTDRRGENKEETTEMKGMTICPLYQRTSFYLCLMMREVPISVFHCLLIYLSVFMYSTFVYSDSFEEKKSIRNFQSGKSCTNDDLLKIQDFTHILSFFCFIYLLVSLKYAYPKKPKIYHE